MGGDHGSRFYVLAVLDFLQKHPSVRVSLFGRSQEITPLISQSQYMSRITLVDCSDVVDMSDSPVFALRHKQSSSMWKSLSALSDGYADACVSGGNTGALVAISSHLLTPVSEIKRPVICKSIPARYGKSFLLDMGANVSCSSELLVRFALLGRLFAEASGVSNPTVALLNIGSEQGKGLPVLGEVAATLEADPAINFVGFVEGSELFSGQVNVIVCDGFVGNVALKSSEGAAKFLMASLRREFQSSIWSRILGCMVNPLLRRWTYRYHPSQLNGAVLLGLTQVVVKSHGSADQLGFFRALEAALEYRTKDTAGKICSYFSDA